MTLTQNHRDLLAAVDELEEPGTHPSTTAAGQRLLEVWKQRGGPHIWHASAPWQGTSPYAEELRDAGLLEVHPGIAEFHHPSEPAEMPKEYWLALTDAGRQKLSEIDSE